MTSGQRGIFVTGTRFNWILQYELDESARPEALTAPLGAVRRGAAEDGVEIVLAFGESVARALLGADCGAEVATMPAIGGTAGSAPSTQDDLLVWIHSDFHDRNFDAALRARRALEDRAFVTGDIPGFTYRDSRDLTGFIDGTANPDAARAPEVALVAPGRPGAGGAHVLAQRWIHDLDGFHALPVPGQEAVFGRTKADSREIGDRPATAHISRVELESESGEELEIFRRSFPYGNPEAAGLFFLAFSSEPRRFEAMLRNMMGASDDGLYDRLTEFSTPVTGSYYFAPSEDALTRVLGNP